MDESQARNAFAALSQETRLGIVRLLVAKGPDGLPAGAVAEAAKVSPSNVSFHLKELERAGLIERALIAPYYVNYHCEHHMFMHLPCHNLPRAHRILRRKGVTERMEVRDGYLTVLRMAASK